MMLRMKWIIATAILILFAIGSYFASRTTNEAIGPSLDELYQEEQARIAAAREREQAARIAREAKVKAELSLMQHELDRAKQAAIDTGHTNSTAFPIQTVSNPTLSPTINAPELPDIDLPDAPDTAPLAQSGSRTSQQAMRSAENTANNSQPTINNAFNQSGSLASELLQSAPNP